MKNINVHLSKDLISKYGIKSFPVRKGDMVRIVRGDADKDDKLNIVGKEGKVIKIYTDEGKVVIENINTAKADGKMKPRKMAPNAMILTKLVLEDKKRRERLTKLASLRNKVVDEEPEPAAEPAVEEEKKEEMDNRGAPEEKEGTAVESEGEGEKDE